MKDGSKSSSNKTTDDIKSLNAEIDRLKRYEKEFQRLNASLHFCEQKFKKLIDNIPDIFYTLDPEGSITFISDAVKQYGYDPLELVGHKIIDIVHPKDRSLGHYRINERRTSPRSTRCFELRLFTKEHDIVSFEMKTRQVDYEPVFHVSAEGLYELADQGSHFLGTIGIARDITERKKVEERFTRYREGLESEVASFKSLVHDLNSIGIALSSEHNLDKLLDMIVREVRMFTHSDGGSLYIKEGDTLSFEIAQNDTFARRYGTVPFKAFKIPIDHNSIAGYVASTGEILNISDTDAIGDEYPFSFDTMRDFDKKMDYTSKSMLVVPMRNHKDEIIGVIQLINALGADGNVVPFDEELRDLVVSLASQAAVAICNSRFIQDIKNLFESIVTYSAQAIDARSPHTAGHSDRVAKLVLLQAETINAQSEGVFGEVFFSDEQLDELRIASFLHDIGKIGVRESVLDKANKLTDDKIESIGNRFAFIMRDIALKAVERKLRNNLTPNEAAALDIETEAKIAELKKDFELINGINVPRYYNDEEESHLNAIAAKSYTDIDGVVKPLLTPDEIEKLRVRKGNLTADERLEIESHVRHTLKILEQIPFTDELKNVPVIAATHHEMLNGTGYPNKLTADDIPLQARMLAVADIFDALTAEDRPYKPPLPLNVTIKILREEAENGRLDRNLVDLFITEEIYSRM